MTLESRTSSRSRASRSMAEHPEAERDGGGRTSDGGGRIVPRVSGRDHGIERLGDDLVRHHDRHGNHHRGSGRTTAEPRRRQDRGAEDRIEKVASRRRIGEPERHPTRQHQDGARESPTRGRCPACRPGQGPQDRDRRDHPEGQGEEQESPSDCAEAVELPHVGEQRPGPSTVHLRPLEKGEAHQGQEENTSAQDPSGGSASGHAGWRGSERQQRIGERNLTPDRPRGEQGDDRARRREQAGLAGPSFGLEHGNSAEEEQRRGWEYRMAGAGELQEHRREARQHDRAERSRSPVQHRQEQPEEKQHEKGGRVADPVQCVDQAVRIAERGVGEQSLDRGVVAEAERGPVGIAAVQPQPAAMPLENRERDVVEVGLGGDAVVAERDGATSRARRFRAPARAA